MGRWLRFCAIGLACAAAVLPTPASAVERWFSRGWYAAVQPRLTAFSNLLPFALFDLLCAIALVALVAWWWRGLRRVPRPGRWSAVRGLTLDTLAAAAIIYLWFLAAWGLNYRREKLETRLDFDAGRVTRDSLVELATEAARNATAVREERSGTLDDPVPRLEAAFARTLSTLSIAPTRTARPKWTVLTALWKRTGVDGMTDPFFLESLVRTDLLPFEQPFVVAHEWSHLAGFADESEASFIAYLTCLQGDADARYSGWLLLYSEVFRALNDIDRATVRQSLGPGPRADLRALAEKSLREINPATAKAGSAVYDRFLKANRLESGLRSYAEVTRLLAGTKMIQPGVPRLRNSSAQGE